MIDGPVGTEPVGPVRCPLATKIFQDFRTVLLRMALRLIEMALPADKEKELGTLLEGQPILSAWHDTLSDGKLLVKILLRAENAESVMDILERRFSVVEGFRVILLPVQASIPRPDEGGTEEERRADQGRIYREEVYSGICDSLSPTRIMVALSVLSSLAAAVGIVYANLPMIIGAMVIAPLLGPNVALALSTALGDPNLGHRAVRLSLAGIASALLIPMLIGFIWPAHVDPSATEIESRTKVGFQDVAVALVAGAACGLAFTTGIPEALVGVMVAVAIVPPLAASGLLIGAGYLESAGGALLLLAANLICINLSGVLTFLVQGIRPNTWWEADRARRATRNAIWLWGILLAALVLIIYLAG